MQQFSRARSLAALVKGATWQQLLAIVLTLFVFLAAIFLAFQPFFDEFLYEDLLASDLEQRFGFRGGRVTVRTPDGERRVYVLLEVSAGGPLDRAGFRGGDVPSGAFHSQSAAFLKSLAAACDYPNREIFIGPLKSDGTLAEQRRVRLPCVR